MENVNHVTPSAARILGIALFAVGTLALSGCGQRSMADLEAYVEAAQSAPAPSIEPLCAQIQCDPWEPTPEYDPEGRPDPFKPFEVAEQGPVDPTPHPYPHPAEELESYALDSLRMVGTFERDGDRFALVRSPDGIIHKVIAGNYMGKNSGRVLHIEEHEIALAEVVWTGKEWEDREASLALIETL